MAPMPPPCPIVGSVPRGRCPGCLDGCARSGAWHTAPSIPEFRLHLPLGVGLVTASSRAYSQTLFQQGRAGERPGPLPVRARCPDCPASQHLLTWGGGLEVWGGDEVT